MNYINRQKIVTNYNEKKEKPQKVLVDPQFINYLYITNIGLYSQNLLSDSYQYPDGLFVFQLSSPITPKYFKLEMLTIPNTFYQQANNRKQDTNPNLGKYIQQDAPLKMVWRETNDGGVTFSTLIYDIDPGNYTMDELVTAVENAMNNSVNNQYEVFYNDITLRITIKRISGVYDYALWFTTYQENLEYYNVAIEQFISEYIGWSIIPLVDDYTTGGIQEKTSPLIADASNDALVLLEISGTPAILQTTSESTNVQSSFNATFVVKLNGNKGDYSSYVVNSDYDNLVYFTSKTTFSNMSISLRNLETGRVMHFNGSSPYILFSYQSYETHENFNL